MLIVKVWLRSLNEFSRSIAHFLDQGGRIDRDKMELQRASVDLGDIEHQVHDLVQTLRPFGNTFQHLMCIFGGREPSSISISVYPIMVVSGVRSSCEAMLMKSDLVWSRRSRSRLALSRVAISLSQFGIELDQVIDQTGIFESDRGLVGESRKRDQVLGGIAVAADLRAERQHTDPFPLREDRQIHFRLEVVEPLPLSFGNRSKCRKQVKVILKKRTTLPRSTAGQSHGRSEATLL